MVIACASRIDYETGVRLFKAGEDRRAASADTRALRV